MLVTISLSHNPQQSSSMESLLETIFPCFAIKRGIQLPTETGNYPHISEKAAPISPLDDEKWRLRNDDAALSIVSAMSSADENDSSLDATIQSLVHAAGGWSEYLAKKILAGLEAVLKAAEPMNAAMQDAYDKAYEALKATEGFAADHPEATAIICTVIALGVLVVLAPYVLEWLGFWLGFGELGPIEGKSRFLRSVAMTMVR